MIKTVLICEADDPLVIISSPWGTKFYPTQDQTRDAPMYRSVNTYIFERQNAFHIIHKSQNI